MSENDPYGSEGGAPNERPYPYNLTEGKAVAGGHCLPVVAEGLIPLIYGRAFFKHRATPIVIAPEEEPN